jgi:hypothetical protein
MGAKKGVQDDLRGCAVPLTDDRELCNEGRVVEFSSSPISMMASPVRVASVFVGETGV